ncbi:guanine nucleotide exchange factor for Rab-3A-like [Nilaparvata lugens]|uniref:guanine nucleotide exchange factor for Rab-3A-like n=1 Tax=Nilaparvata lugens TaxID=108931 RepID=UPI00193EB786|nr:guanine nucleotide exchange factor for Rab-3A-like [Nilaparvata lugens]
MNGFCSGRSRSDPDEDIDDLLLPGGRQNNEGFDHLPLDSGVESAASSWDRMAESAHARLQDELRRAHHKLKLKDEEVTRLSRIRNEVEAELEELTASLFQEAHNMVREANVAQAAAEKALKESHMQIDVLTAEVAALKTLVLTSTPSRPNPHLHPQIDPKSKEDHGGNGSGLFRKQHRRSPSHFNLKYGRENSPPDSPAKEQKAPQSQVDTGDNVDMLEVRS